MCEVTTYDAKTTQNMGGYSGTHIFDEGVNPFLDHFLYQNNRVNGGNNSL